MFKASAKTSVKGTERSAGGSFFQPKLTVNQPNDSFEQEADAMADKVMRLPDASPGQDPFFKPTANAVQRKCQAGEEEDKFIRRKEAGESNVQGGEKLDNYVGSLGSSGQPLSDNSRSFFEPRFGSDFSNVRLHTDAVAAKSAQSINALAYTSGNNIVFNGGQYAPESETGKKLMAHELTHVVQQSGGLHASPAAIQRKTPPKVVVPAYHQEALDLLADARKDSIIGAQRVPLLEKYEAFTEALTKDDVANLPGLLDDFLKSDKDKLPIGHPVRTNMGQIIAKLMTLGLSKEAGQLQTFFPALQKSQGDIGEGFDLKIYLWDTITDQMPDLTKIKDPAAAATAADAWLLYFKRIADEIGSQDKNEIEKEKTARKNDITDFSTFGGLTLHRSTVLEYLADLNKNLIQAFTQFQVAYQIVLDKAIDDLGKGKGDEFLKLAKAKVAAMAALTLPDELRQKDVEITKTIFNQKDGKFVGGKHVDYFMDDKEAKKHSVTIDFYDPDPSMLQPDEKSLDISRIHAIREKQINALEQLYGFQKDKQGNLTAEATENAAITKGGTLKLNSDEDWRKFLLEKYNAHKAATGDKVGAFESVMDTIRLYLNAFTIHTPYNIEDEINNQLTIDYPRAMTGQLIHDCCVYALRIVYMMSLLKDQPDLQLSIRFIRLPVHAGLIITGNGLPTYFTHNDSVIKYKESVIKDSRQDWDDASARNNIPVPPGKQGDDQFLGETAAAEFIPGVDIPFRLVDAPGVPVKDDKTKGKKKGGALELTGKREKDVEILWKFYKEKIMPDVFSKSILDPKSSEYRFHLLYLDALESFKKYYNSIYVPFWNTVVGRWQKNKKALQDADAEVKKAAAGKDHDAALKKFNDLFDAYQKPINDAFPQIDQAFQPIREKLLAINKFIADNPDVIAKDAMLGDSFRMFEMDNDKDWIVRQKEMATDDDVTKPDDRREIIAEPLN